MSGSHSFRSAFLRAPLLRAVTPFIIGLLFGRACNVPVPLAWLVAAAIMSGWSWIALQRTSYAQRWMAGVWLWPACCAFGVLWQRLHVPENHADDLSYRTMDVDGASVRIAEVVSSNAHYLRAWADVEAVHSPSGLSTATGRLGLTLSLDSGDVPPNIGDRVLVHSAIDTIDRVAAPGSFDLTAWAASNKAWHQCTARQGQWCVAQRARGWTRLFDRWRQAITMWLQGSTLDVRERGLVKAILIGVRDELDQDQRDAFARSGTMHVLAVSGSHVGLIYAAFVFGLAFLGQRRAGRIARGLITIAMLWTYAGLTGFTPSVLRATITFTFFSVAEMTPWRTEPLNSLFGAAGILLLWDPDMLVQLSFQLSFLAVLGIALFYRPILDKWAPPNAVLRYAWSLFAVSLSAQVMTTPLALLTFKAFPIWFLPANMVIVGLVSLGVFGGAALLLLHAVPVLGAFVTACMEGLLLVLDRASSFFAGLPGAYPAVRIDAWQCVGLYALVMCAAAWLLQRWRWARWATVVCMLIVLLQWGWVAHQRNTQQVFVVHDDRDARVCALVKGRERLIYADTLDVGTRPALEREGRALGVERTRYLPLERMASGFPVLHAYADVAVLVDHWPVGKEGGVPGIDSTMILVLCPRLRPREREAAEQWALQRSVPVYDLRARGAYVR